MTRKKYQSDTYGEALKDLFFSSTDSESDDEEYVPDEDEVWELVSLFLEQESRNTPHEWMNKWIDPTFYINMVDAQPVSYNFYEEAVPLLMPFETRADLETIYSMVYEIAHLCLGYKASKRPTYDLVDGMVIELLRERTKYYYIGPNTHHRSIVNRKSFRMLQKC